MKNKQIPMWGVLLIDAVLLGMVLINFALFHHVLPSVYSEDLSKDALVNPILSGSDAMISDEQESKFADKFTDEIVTTPTSYTSPGISVTLSDMRWENSDCHILDVYLDDITSLRSAFAKDQYGHGIYEEMSDIAARNNAICAVNGDYYSCHRSYGVVIRNGVLYRNNPNGDVCAITVDGVMHAYTKEQFSSDPSLAANVWQAWCFGPSLLDENGVAKEQFDSSVTNGNPRTAIGYYEPGHYCFITVDGRARIWRARPP